MYPHCKHGIFAPTDWDPSQLERSAAVPDMTMELDFVHGYEGRSTLSSNVHFNAEGEVVYHIAAVGIVYCRSTHKQTFFNGHNDDILCMAMHPDKVTVASGQVSSFFKNRTSYVIVLCTILPDSFLSGACLFCVLVAFYHDDTLPQYMVIQAVSCTGITVSTQAP